MIRSDHLGVSSIVRELNLTDNSYKLMLDFFRSGGWYVVQLRDTWLSILKHCGFLIVFAERYVMIGDGVKAAKEGRRMPGVKRLHQESDNSGKGEYIFGHHFGGLGILAGNAKKLYSVLISARLHEGIAAPGKWLDQEEHKEDTHIVKMICDAGAAAAKLGKSILLLDRLFLTVSMLKALAENPLLCVVTKAKSNAVAFLPPGEYKGRGARAKKGARVKLADLFESHAALFSEETLVLYGKATKTRYYCVNLHWGKGWYQPLRFVLTDIDGVQSILVSTDLTLSPTEIILLYTRRFKIECAFRELKQVVAGFAYRFWCKSMPKLGKYKKNEANEAELLAVSDSTARKRIKATIHAIEGFVQISIIALGLLQLISLKFGDVVNSRRRFMRTITSTVPSERTVADYIRKNLYCFLLKTPEFMLTTIIKSKQLAFSDSDFDHVA